MSRYEVKTYKYNDEIIITIFDNMDDCSYNTMLSKSFITEKYNQTIDNFSTMLSYSIQNNSYDIKNIDDNVELYIKYDNIITFNYNIVLTKNGKLEDNEDINILNDIKTSLYHNFDVINNVLIEKKRNIKNHNYCKSIKLAEYYDRQLVTRLEAIYNSFQNIDERLKRLEEK